MSWKTLRRLVMGNINKDTPVAMAKPIMKPFKSLETNAKPSDTVTKVPARVMVTDAKMEKATMGSCSSIGRHARMVLATLLWY